MLNYMLNHRVRNGRNINDDDDDDDDNDNDKWDNGDDTGNFTKMVRQCI
jgi:hypothetical protein